MLVDKAEIKVRFSEVDSMGILWHGHYIKYFEDGRESFGRNFNLGYFDVYDEGYLIPIVKIDCSFKKPVRYKDEVVIETKFIDTPAAKIIFEYKLYDKQSGDVYATGRSEQVFLNNNRQLYLTVPDFFARWKQHWGIVK